MGGRLFPQRARRPFVPDKGDEARQCRKKSPGAFPARLGALDKKYPRRGGWFLPSCVIGRVTAPLGFWPFFGANCASRFFCSLSG